MIALAIATPPLRQVEADKPLGRLHPPPGLDHRRLRGTVHDVDRQHISDTVGDGDRSRSSARPGGDHGLLQDAGDVAGGELLEPRRLVGGGGTMDGEQQPGSGDGALHAGSLHSWRHAGFPLSLLHRQRR